MSFSSFNIIFHHHCRFPIQYVVLYQVYCRYQFIVICHLSSFFQIHSIHITSTFGLLDTKPCSSPYKAQETNLSTTMVYCHKTTTYSASEVYSLLLSFFRLIVVFSSFIVVFMTCAKYST